MRKIWDENNNHLLGTKTDKEIAQLLNINSHIVTQTRLKYHIESFQRKNPAYIINKEKFSRMTDEELMKPYKQYYMKLVNLERLKRGLPTRVRNRISKRMGKESLRSFMAYSARKLLSPRPSFKEIGEIFGVSSQRAAQLAGYGEIAKYNWENKKKCNFQKNFELKTKIRGEL